MKKLVIGLALLLLFFVTSTPVLATYDPLSIANNKVGVHILFPSELPDAARLVNGNGGDWGYVTIPIQAGDKDLKKWQDFMNQASSLHIIPIIRLATEGDYFNTSVWRKPDYADVLDFANFLNSLQWPVKNRYVIVFNEVNRGNEWGGQPNPTEYANILSYAVTAFKSKSSDFFILSSGMDNAAANSGSAMSEYTFFQEMNTAVPGIFNQVDGIASHSYPNPAFSSAPWVTTNESIDSFQFERSMIEGMASKNLPVFITETGWSRQTIPDTTISSYFQNAFTSVWKDNDIVAITPFLLKAGAGPFNNFSLFNTDGSENQIFKTIENLPKVKGLPTIVPVVLAASSDSTKNLPVKKFSKEEDKAIPIIVSDAIKTSLKWFLGL